MKDKDISKKKISKTKLLYWVKDLNNQLIFLLFLVGVGLNFLILSPIKEKNEALVLEIERVNMGEYDNKKVQIPSNRREKSMAQDLEFYRSLSRNKRFSKMELGDLDGRNIYKMTFKEKDLPLDDFICNLKLYGKKVYINKVSYQDGTYNVDLFRK